MRSMFQRISNFFVRNTVKKSTVFPLIQKQYTTNSSRMLTFDIAGILYAGKIMLVLSVLITGWSLWTPHVSSLAQEEGIESPTEGTPGGMGDTEDTDNLTIAQLLDFDADPAPTVHTEDAVQYAPKEGPFVSIDLIAMKLTLFQEGVKVQEYSIMRAPDEAARALVEGKYVVSDRAEAEVSTLAMVRFPYYVRFGGSYAVHGVPTHASGEVFDGMRAEGSVMLSDEDAQAVFDFVTIDTPVSVRTAPTTPPFGAYTKLVVAGDDLPATSARSYAVAELSRGQVLIEKKAGVQRPIASITKLFTALVADELIKEEEEVSLGNGESYQLGDLYYPLLLRSDNTVAASMAHHAGSSAFMAAMNEYVQSLGMPLTSFADSSGLSPENVSTAYDLTTFARHIYTEQTDMLNISKTPGTTITSVSGMHWRMTNQNKLASDPYFVGGKLGFTDEAAQTALSIFALPVDGQVHVIAVVVLGSQDWKQDTRTLLRWLLENVEHGA